MLRKATELPHSKFQHVYVVLRFDFPLDTNEPSNAVSAVKVFASRERADEEATRLNRLNQDKQCWYEVQISRFDNDGASFENPMN